MGAEARVLKLWRRWGGTPLGRKLYSLALSYMVPYSGTIRPLVLQLQPGYALIELRDRRILRNHLNCIHAIALANLGELASGLALLSALPGDVRGIVVKLEIEYLKKARGRLTARGRSDTPRTVTETIIQIVDAEIEDAAGERVAQLKVHWQLRPKGQTDV